MIFISKKKLLKVAVEIYLLEDTAFALSEKDLYFRMGHSSAIEYLCSRFGLDLTGAIKAAKKSGEVK